MEGVIGVTEAAARKGVTTEAVRNAIRDGRLPATRCGWMWLIREADLDQWVISEGRLTVRRKAERASADDSNAEA